MNWLARCQQRYVNSQNYKTFGSKFQQIAAGVHLLSSVPGNAATSASLNDERHFF